MVLPVAAVRVPVSARVAIVRDGSVAVVRRVGVTRASSSLRDGHGFWLLARVFVDHLSPRASVESSTQLIAESRRRPLHPDAPQDHVAICIDYSDFDNSPRIYVAGDPGIGFRSPTSVSSRAKGQPSFDVLPG